MAAFHRNFGTRQHGKTRTKANEIRASVRQLRLYGMIVVFCLAKFQFTPVMRRATKQSFATIFASSFNSRPSCDGRPDVPGVPGGRRRVSIHARRATGDSLRAMASTASRCFNSRPSCDGRLGPLRRRVDLPVVSIHARHATGDLPLAAMVPVITNVSIHARHATGDPNGEK